MTLTRSIPVVGPTAGVTARRPGTRGGPGVGEGVALVELLTVVVAPGAEEVVLEVPAEGVVEVVLDGAAEEVVRDGAPEEVVLVGTPEEVADRLVAPPHPPSPAAVASSPTRISRPRRE